MARLNAHPFRPAWWLPGRHAQSIWAPMFRRSPEAPIRRERWDTPDSDFLDLHFCDGAPEKPLVLMLHGLEGNANSFYIRGMNVRFRALGWTSVTMEFRSCGGEMNRARRIYHMGETTDLDFVLRRLAQRFPDNALYLLGVSLGANVSAKWLGEMGETVPSMLRGAAVISAPFEPHLSAPQFHEILFGLYTKRFLKSLIAKAILKEAQYPGSIDIEAVKRCKTFYEFDTLVTAVFHGFEDAGDYWRRVACRQFLPGIRVPTLLVSAADDPFNPGCTLPREDAERSEYLYPLFSDRGGHVGFIAGGIPFRPRYWAEEQVVRFFLLHEEFARR